jgi:hypothetical protein
MMDVSWSRPINKKSWGECYAATGSTIDYSEFERGGIGA